MFSFWKLNLKSNKNFTKLFITNLKSRISQKNVPKTFNQPNLFIRTVKFVGFSSIRTAVFLFPSTLLITHGLIPKIFAKKKISLKTLSEGNREKNEDFKFPWFKFLGLLKPYLPLLIIAILGAILIAYLNIKIPVTIGELVNVLLKSRSGSQSFHQDITPSAKKLFFYYILQALTTSIFISVLFKIGEGISKDLKVQLFRSILEKEIAFFDQTRTGDLISRLTVDIHEFKSSFKMFISQGLKNLIQTLGCIFSMYQLSPIMTFFIVSSVSTLIVFGSLLGSSLRIISSLNQKQLSKESIVAEEAIGNMKTVRAFAMENIENQNYEKEADELKKLGLKLGYGISVFQGLSNLSTNVLLLSSLLFGGTLLAENQLDPGVLMAFFVATQSLQRSLNKLSLLYGITLQGLNAGSRVYEYMSEVEIKSPNEGIKIERDKLKSEIEFKGISFAYPTRKSQKVLKNFNLKIEGGKKVALVGPSGGGKTTVTCLLERFYDVDEGLISIDGVDLKELDPSWIRGDLIGYISQEPVLFGSTILENIKYGKPSCKDEEVYEAAKQAHAHEFITSFPKGYQTVLGERGLSLSGGQKQRIAIARALIKNPAILVLDEATSALDVKSEKVVQEAIDKISAGRTVLIIAHRLSSIKNVDKVAVVVDGAIVEHGTPRELRKKKGPFWHMSNMQTN